MEMLPVISTPWSEAWVAWTMLGILVLGAIAHDMQPQAIGMAFRSLFTIGDRSSMFIDTNLDRRAEIIMIILSICTFSMGAYTSVVAYLGSGVYSFQTYGLIVLISLGIMLVRAILEMIAAYTFVPQSKVHTLYYHYYHLTVCTALIHFPIVLLCLFWGALTPRAIILLNVAVIAFYLFTVLIKSCLLLMRSLKGFIYILITVITLELIPFVAVIGCSYLLINN